MPIFEYTCNACDKTFEEIVFSNDEVVECPQCKGKDCAKLISRSRHTSNANFDFSSLSGQTSLGGGSACGSCSGGNCSTCK